MTDTETAVDNGIAWLNEFGPAEWWERIDFTELNIEEGRSCVLGQVFAAKADETGIVNGYLYVMYANELDTAPHFNQFVVTHGFIAAEESPEALEDEWARQVVKLRDEVNA